MTTSTLSLDTPDGPMPAYEASPDGDARGGVVVVQEAFGLTSHIESICRRLADAGYRAVAPALFHRSGSPVFDYGDYEKLMPVMKELTAAGIRVDVDTAVDHLATSGFGAGATGIVG
ncbi:MAG TPA: dienelactone hydrolase family protein, partial [Acidimicrobiales bacterium]|nr:dienelactone hydrolase family protein [Acidimicrobiales bacterium]